MVAIWLAADFGGRGGLVCACLETASFGDCSTVPEGGSYPVSLVGDSGAPVVLDEAGETTGRVAGMFGEIGPGFASVNVTLNRRSVNYGFVGLRKLRN